MREYKELLDAILKSKNQRVKLAGVTVGSSALRKGLNKAIEDYNLDCAMMDEDGIVDKVVKISEQEGITTISLINSTDKHNHLFKSKLDFEIVEDEDNDNQT